MPIPFILTHRLREALTRHPALADDRTLRAVFVDERLAPWRDHAPEATPNRAARVDALIAALCDQTDTHGQNALALFLHTLADQTESANALHAELAELAAELATLPPAELADLKTPADNIALTGDANIIGDGNTITINKPTTITDSHIGVFGDYAQVDQIVYGGQTINLLVAEEASGTLFATIDPPVTSQAIAAVVRAQLAAATDETPPDPSIMEKLDAILAHLNTLTPAQAAALPQSPDPALVTLRRDIGVLLLLVAGSAAATGAVAGAATTALILALKKLWERRYIPPPDELRLVPSQPEPSIYIPVLTALDDHQRGWNAKRTGNYDQAITNYTQALADLNKAIELDPEDPGAYNNRGVVYARTGEYNKALADYNYALKLDPSSIHAYVGRGMVYYMMGDYEAALADTNHVLKLDPAYAEVYSNRGSIYADMREHAKALADYTRTLELNPQYADAYYNRGLVHHNLNHLRQAIADHTRALELNPQYADAYYDRGNIHEALGDLRQALADYTRAIEFNPQDADASIYILRGDIHKALGDLRQAIADYTRAIELDPHLANIAYIIRGNTHKALGDVRQALADYTRAIELDPRNAETYYQRALLYRDTGHRAFALADFTQARALSLYPELKQEAQTAIDALNLLDHLTGSLTRFLDRRAENLSKKKKRTHTST